MKIIYCLLIGLLLFCRLPQASAQTADSLDLSLEQLFARGTSRNLLLKADALKELMAAERMQTARMKQLPDIQVGLRGGMLGQPVVFEHGLSDPTRPESPDWQQNYAIDFTQPLYEGGRIKYAIRRASLEKRLASLQTDADRADLKLELLRHYLDLFSLYKHTTSPSPSNG